MFRPDDKRIVWGCRVGLVALNECPVSYISRESEWWISQFAAARALKTPLTAGGLLEWPARAVDAFLLLETESHAEIETSPH